MQPLPLQPRLARVLIEAGGARGRRGPARSCRSASSRRPGARRRPATSCGSLDAWASLPPHVRQVAATDRGSGGGARRRRRRAARSGRRTCGGRCSSATPIAWRGGARRRARRWCSRPGPAPSSAARAASATASSWSRSTSQAPTRPGDPNALVRMASRVERDWIAPTAIAVEHAFDPRTGRVRAWRARARTIGSSSPSTRRRPSPPPRRELAGGGVAGARARRDQRRLAPPGPLRRPRDRPAVARARRGRAGARRWPRSIWPRMRRTRWRRELDRLAPDAPGPAERAAHGAGLRGGRHRRRRRSKLQELFGLAETPRVGPSRAPVVLALLAPNGRPVQTTRDLRSFWDRTYPEVRQGAARPLSAAPVARGSVDRDADGEGQAEAAFLVSSE